MKTLKVPIQGSGKVLSLSEKIIYCRVAWPSPEGLEFILIEDILYVQSFGNYSRIKTTALKEVVVLKSMAAIEEILSRACFVRVHHQYIVNVHHILRYTKGKGGAILLQQNITIPVSREKKKNFLAKVMVV